MVLNKGVFIVFLMFCFTAVHAQEHDSARINMGIVQDGDTLIFKNIKEVVVFPERTFKNNRQYRRYSRYVQKVKKVYPLAVEARELLKEYEPQYYALEDQIPYFIKNRERQDAANAMY